MSDKNEKTLKLPKVSVCIVTYNQEKYIGACLQSIVDQVTDFDFEVIVADDCSIDATKKVINEFSSKYPGVIKTVLHEKNVGPARNYRSAHDIAIGEYIAHCDGDDMWLPGKLSHQVSLLDKNPHASQCWGFAHLINDDGNRIGVFPSMLAKWVYPRKVTAQHIALSYALVGQHSTQIYRRKFKFDFDVSRPALDYWIAFNMALRGHAIYSKKFVGCYRVTNTESITRTSSKSKMAVDFLGRHLVDISIKHPEYSREAKANIINRYFFSKLKSHDLSDIEQSLMEMKAVNTRILLVFKSMFYFLIQKIK